MIQTIKNGYMTTDYTSRAVRIVRTSDLHAVLDIGGVGTERRIAVTLTADKLRELAEMATSMANRIDGFSYVEDIDR